ncbi:MAG: hypothetical protein E6319_10030 [Anaerococcus vaginalis]|nr:hypothetical protein [Anaerococcus vaginalis]
MIDYLNEINLDQKLIDKIIEFRNEDIENERQISFFQTEKVSI